MLTPRRRRGVELLDDPRVDAALRQRSHADIDRSNRLLGGRRAGLAALRPVLDGLSAAGDVPDGEAVTLLDVGTGLADIPVQARAAARRRGLRLVVLGVDAAPSLLVAARARGRLDHAVAGDALRLPIADRGVDVVLCSQLLHHFEHDDAVRLLRELTRVARHAVIVCDLRRSRLAASGFWLASWLLRFHPITRHDGVVSVYRGFTADELRGLVVEATGARAEVRRRLGYRLTATWPAASFLAP